MVGFAEGTRTAVQNAGVRSRTAKRQLCPISMVGRRCAPPKVPPNGTNRNEFERGKLGQSRAPEQLWTAPLLKNGLAKSLESLRVQSFHQSFVTLHGGTSGHVVR